MREDNEAFVEFLQNLLDEVIDEGGSSAAIIDVPTVTLPISDNSGSDPV